MELKEVDQLGPFGYKAPPMPQNPHAVRKKRARRIKKLIRWHEKRAEAEEKSEKPADKKAK